MITVFSLSIALAITLLAGIALSGWLWIVRRHQLVIAAGLQALASMRWREFSQFVIEVLQEQGFEASRTTADNQRSAPADLQLARDDETWLLSCKQALNSRVSVAMVDELAKNLRITSVTGGILVTLGEVDAEARGRHSNVELVDGATLWPLIDPQLPPSLHADLVARARSKTVHATVLAWVAALALGIVGAMAVQLVLPDDVQSPVAAEAAPARATPSRTAPEPRTPPPPSTQKVPELDEAAQREAVVAGISVLPGVERAGWVTNSTLLVLLLGEKSSEQLDKGICATLAQFPQLQASRVQMEPPEGSDKPVRFMQCSPF